MEIKKIAFFICSLGTGGAEKQLYLLCKNIDKKAWHPVVVAHSGGKWEEEFKQKNIEVHVIRRMINVKGLINYFKLQNNKIEIIAMWNASLPGAIFSEFKKKETVSVFCERGSGHNVIEDKNTLSIRLIQGRSFLIANSERALNAIEAQGLFKGKKRFVIENGIEVPNGVECESSIRRDLNIREEKIIICNIGNICPDRNMKMFLDVAKIVTEIEREVIFLHVGAGKLTAAEEEKLKTIAQGKVIFAGERDDGPQIGRSIDIYLLTSDREGMPNAMLEAMAWGKPVVANDVGQVSKVIKNGENGLIVEKGDHEKMASIILELLKNKEMAKEMGKRAKKTIEDKYSVDKMVKKYQEVFEEIINIGI